MRHRQLDGNQPLKQTDYNQVSKHNSFAFKQNSLALEETNWNT